MNPKLSEDQRRAILAHPEGAVRVEDEQTHKLYVIVEEDLHHTQSGPAGQDDVAAIQAGIDAAADGRVAPSKRLTPGFAESWASHKGSTVAAVVWTA